MPAGAALAFIPSPSDGVLHLGPVPFHMYGLLLAIGVLVAVRVTEVRWVRRGHRAKDFSDMVVWIVIGGVVGARVYHLITDFQLYTHHLVGALEIWDGGLSIWGAVMGGALVALILARRRRLDFADLADCIAPALAFAQAMGRWGNYFNQELFGGPTRLPWALEIDVSHRPAGYTQFATFQPTFLYESLYCVLLGCALLWIDHHVRLRKGQLFCLYVAGYTVARFVFEEMRIDPAHTIGPLRVNAWVAAALFVGSLVLFWWLRTHGAERPQEPRDLEPASETGDLGPAT